MSDTMEIDAPVLASLKAVAEDLIRISLKCQVGALQVQPGGKAISKEQELLEWLEYEEWLQRQIDEYDQRLGTDSSLPVHNAAKLSPEEIADKEFEVKKSIDALKDELLALSSQNAVTEQLLERLEANESYLRIIFAQHGDPAEVRLLQEALQFRDKLVSEFLREYDGFKTLKARLDHLQKTNRGLKQEIRETKAKLDLVSKEKKKIDPAQQSAIVARKKEELSNMEARNTILRNVLQNLVLESGINWAEDYELRDLMMRLETTFL